MSFRGFATYPDLTVPAGEERAINAHGAYVVCYASTLASFKLALDDDAASEFFAGAEVTLPEGGEFHKIRVINNNPGAITVSIGTAFAEFRDRRVTLSGNVGLTKATIFDTVADVSVAALGTEVVLAANTTRREAIIQNLDGLSPVRIGDGNVAAARGIRLDPGESIRLSTTEAISVHNPSGGAVSIAVASTAD